MSPTHHSTHIHVPRARPLRCFRHHVSMASCEECRRVRTDQLARRREAARAAELIGPPAGSEVGDGTAGRWADLGPTRETMGS